MSIKVVFRPVIPISKRPVADAPILPWATNKLMPAPAAVTCMLAVLEFKFADEVSMIEPAVAVILTAPAAEELVMMALAPKFTLRPEDRVIVPE